MAFSELKQVCQKMLPLILVTATLSGCQEEVPLQNDARANLIATAKASAPTEPRCHFMQDTPYHNIALTCVELVYDEVTPLTTEAVPSLMGLAFDSNNTLYMARTALNEIWTMQDTDSDHFMDKTVLYASDLDLPVSLTVYKEAVYVRTANSVIRLVDVDQDGQADQRTILVDSLPTGTGFWGGSIGIGPDERLYISVGANCNACVQADKRRGALISYALDGSDERIEANGFRFPSDFAWDPDTGELWIVDNERFVPGLEINGPPDELNRFAPGANYGFPYCYGDLETDKMLRPETDDFCATTQAPVVQFPYQSRPSGIAFYSGSAFPFWTKNLIVVWAGSNNVAEPAGYAVVVVGFTDGQPNQTLEYIAPTWPLPPDEESSVQLNTTGKGLFPYHPVDVVVSPEGWIYVSFQEGRILRFRRRSMADIVTG